MHFCAGSVHRTLWSPELCTGPQGRRQVWGRSLGGLERLPRCKPSAGTQFTYKSKTAIHYLVSKKKLFKKRIFQRLPRSFKAQKVCLSGLSQFGNTASSREGPADVRTPCEAEHGACLQLEGSDSTPHPQLRPSLAVKGKHVFLVASYKDDRRSEVLGQGLQPGHVQRTGALPLPSDGQGAVGGRVATEELPGAPPHSPAQGLFSERFINLLFIHCSFPLTLRPPCCPSERSSGYLEPQSISKQTHSLHIPYDPFSPVQPFQPQTQ